ncbi:hypothetical protein P389DRAFT_171944 [Cystobasidium minutum MCA 4210]|uniref:uncharacterized protein n=1 Tax=Cystobasidium minutum MCA 4210 TaxID=1397322 RepID=UPI0034CEED97|eukprot:jgi/Rhomi1/171944/fgenesh1_kg.4_\
MAATSRYSSSDTGRGRGSWASVAAGSAAIRPSASPPPVLIEREGCLCLELPKESRITLADVAVALGQQGGSEANWQPFMHDEHIVLQALTSGANIDAQKARFLAEGLQIKSIKAKCTELINSVNNKDLVEGRIEALTASKDGQRLMKAQLETLGRLITFNLETFPGSNGVPTGNATFLLDISEHGKAPKTFYILDFGTWSNRVKVSIIGRQKFCYYCRESSHLRRDCPHAPQCQHCGSRTHSPLRCTSPEAYISDPEAYGPGPASLAHAPAAPSMESSLAASILPPNLAIPDASVRQIAETPEREISMHQLSSQESQSAIPPLATSALMNRSRSWAGEMEEDDDLQDERDAAEVYSMLSTQSVTLTQDDGFRPVTKKTRRYGTKLRLDVQAPGGKVAGKKRRL